MGTNRELTVQDIRAQIIWGNEHICDKKGVLFYKHWITSGIIFVSDLCTRRGFVNVEALSTKLTKKSNVLMEFKSILESMPKPWRESIKNIHCTVENIELTEAYIRSDIGSLQNMSTLNICKSFKQKEFIKPIIELKWERTFQQSYSWKSIWRNKVCIKETNLLSLTSSYFTTSYLI